MNAFGTDGGDRQTSSDQRRDEKGTEDEFSTDEGGESINLGKFRIEFIKTNHSIQDASALAIYSPAGVVVHTGDFKVDYTPVFGDAIDLPNTDSKTGHTGTNRKFKPTVSR